MAVSHNVFRGTNSVADFFDPDKNPPLPLVEIPDRLNPYRRDGVRIYAKMLTHLPAQNVKSLPALKMLREIPEARDNVIVEASSGSTVLSLGIIARVLWGHNNVNAYVTNKKPPESLNLLRLFGITPHLYGGLAQQEPTDETGIMCRLRRLVTERHDTVYPGQYDNANNWKAHEQWTGPQILKQLPETNIFCTTVGTGGCITGTASYLKSQKPSCRILGVFNVFGDATPGPRHFQGFNTCGFPWAEHVDTFVEVPSVDSYRMSMHLSREGLIAGPSSGQALRGLLDYIGQLKKAGGLSQLADETTGEVSCVFTCSDLPYHYLGQYFQKLGADEFPPIQNKILLQCDQLRHDERWILDPPQALEMLRRPTTLDKKNETSISSTSLSSNLEATPPPPTLWSTLRSCLSGVLTTSFSPPANRGPPTTCCPTHSTTLLLPADNTTPLVLDLRSPQAFQTQHIPHSINLPLAALTPELVANGDLFGDADAVHAVWSGMQALFAGPQVAGLLEGVKRDGRAVVLVCYDGDASRLGTAMLREGGVEGFSVAGGGGGGGGGLFL
ncbi:tryptophan synthase beta subunit-like PLP-dependent enzyme [Chaetomidium leptoderma]|uniref:Tryptophan synthase beta subunit-like PLP-dependent enzyme n=1 Tax=Chaetomidium leptoderma TaxID=669021 RepID=A0AAN6ZY83_9PEZI|nr:tryptophan synthase beta subunit-like PLP-dependent enzyme [Chaetomidium leptoderma]